MNYEYGLKNHAATDKSLIVGPWYHLDAPLHSRALRVLAWPEKTVSSPGISSGAGWTGGSRANKIPLCSSIQCCSMSWEKKNGGRKNHGPWPLPDSRIRPISSPKRRLLSSLATGFGVTNAANNYKLVATTATTDYNNVFLGYKTPKVNPVLYHNPAALNGVASRSAQRWFGFSPLTIVTQVSKYMMKTDWTLCFHGR